MIARQHYDERLLRYQSIFEIRLRFAAQECDVELSTLEIIGEVCRKTAGDPDFDVGQFVAEDTGRMRQPIDFLPGQKSDRETRFGGLRGPARGFCGGLGVIQRKPGLVEEGASGGGQLRSARASVQ